VKLAVSFYTCTSWWAVHFLTGTTFAKFLVVFWFECTFTRLERLLPLALKGPVVLIGSNGILNWLIIVTFLTIGELQGNNCE
jgi:hypothetical protein